MLERSRKSYRNVREESIMQYVQQFIAESNKSEDLPLGYGQTNHLSKLFKVTPASRVRSSFRSRLLPNY